MCVNVLCKCAHIHVCRSVIHTYNFRCCPPWFLLACLLWGRIAHWPELDNCWTHLHSQLLGLLNTDYHIQPSSRGSGCWLRSSCIHSTHYTDRCICSLLWMTCQRQTQLMCFHSVYWITCSEVKSADITVIDYSAKYSNFPCYLAIGNHRIFYSSFNY